MKRRLLNSTTALLLLLCVAASLGVLGWFGYAVFPFPGHDGVALLLADDVKVPVRGRVEAWESTDVLGFKVGVRWIGGTVAGRGNFLARYRYVIVPYWFCALAALAAAGWTGRRIVMGVRGARSRRRTRDGLCARCGYDLRASPGRCPECGHATPVTAET